MQRKHLIVTASIAATLLALTGCTGSPEPEPSGSASASAEAEAPQTLTEIIDDPSNEGDMTGAAADNVISTCELADGAWQVAGTVTNSAEDTVNYRIYISLLAEDGSTRAVKQVNADGVEAGAESAWEMTIEVADEDLSCVPRVERRPA